MPTALSLYLPTWSIDRVKRRSARQVGEKPLEEKPVVLAVSQAGRQRVECCCPLAQAAGVVVGMALAEARAVLGRRGGWFGPFEPEQDQRALLALARWATRFSPRVALDPPDGLLIDITGCERLFGGWPRLLDRVATDVGRLGLRVRVAIGPTFGCAWAVARGGEHDRVIIPGHGVREALGPLSIAALRVDAETVAALAEVDVYRIDQLFDLPRRSLRLRVGSRLLHRLDQALGRADEVIQPVHVHPPLRVQRVFDGPVKRPEVIAITTQKLLAGLCERLRQRACGVRAVQVVLERADLKPACLVITLGRPSRHSGHLWALVRRRIEKVQLGFGVEAVSLVATETQRVPFAQQPWSWGGQDRDGGAEDTDMAQTLDVWTNRLGHHRVTYARPVASHLPEKALRHEPVTPCLPPPVGCGVWIDRPSVLLDRPRPIRVASLQPEGPPLWLCENEQRHRVESSFGPERIGCEWWQPVTTPHGGVATRDYFKVQCQQGRWLWIYRDLASGRWFLHGLWA